jgi:hypothetical protein
MENKVCTKCKVEKEVTLFLKRSATKDGYNGWCKECSNETTKKYKQANPEKVKESQTKWYQANSEKVKEKTKKYQQENSEKVKEKTKKYQQANSEKLKEKTKKYKQANPEKVKESQTKSNLKRSGWPVEAITEDLIQLKLVMTKIKNYGK